MDVTYEQIYQALTGRSEPWGGRHRREEVERIADLLSHAPDADEARLGLATTAQLLDELRTRIEIDYYNGGGGLEYSTVAGRPESAVSR